MSDQRYNLRGVSASKEDVHNAIKNVDKGIFPKAFCKIIPDYLGGDPEYCNIMHADGAGTKSSLAYMYWKEMYKVFNMGHRMEIYLSPDKAAKVIEISESMGIPARIVGRVEDADSNKLTIISEKGTFEY